MRRLTLLAILALGLAPGTWVRTDVTDNYDAPITFTEIETREGISGPLRFIGAWEITTSNSHFGGYSALVQLANGNLYAGSDRGRVMEFQLRDGHPVAEGARLDYLPGSRSIDRDLADLESFTRDPESGTLWAGYEHGNVIERIAANGAIKRVKPPEMTEWSLNSGPETMVRLSDGRFLVLGEAPEKRGLEDRPALLFDGDPVEGAKSIAFRFDSTPKFSPVDAVQLPDGDVLILMRRVQYHFPAEFDAQLVRADPSKIVEGEVWTGDVLQTLRGRTYGENFEGIEFVADANDPEAGSLYLIADDNLSAFQRTILLRFAWPPDDPGEDAGRPNVSDKGVAKDTAADATDKPASDAGK